jgi:hypothetical protein
MTNGVRRMVTDGRWTTNNEQRTTNCKQTEKNEIRASKFGVCKNEKREEGDRIERRIASYEIINISSEQNSKIESACLFDLRGTDSKLNTTLKDFTECEMIKPIWLVGARHNIEDALWFVKRDCDESKLRSEQFDLIGGRKKQHCGAASWGPNKLIWLVDVRNDIVITRQT